MIQGGSARILWRCLGRCAWAVAHPPCKIHRGARLEARSALGRFNVLFPGAAVHESAIGDHTYLQQNAAVMNAEIGKFCSIAGGAFVGLPQHALDNVSSHPAFYLRNTPLAKTYATSDLFQVSRRTFLGHDVWVGQNALIMGGVRVGTGAVIGCAAVVTKDVPDYAIVVGSPARVIRFRFSEETIRRLLATKWWDRSEEWRERNVDVFKDPGQLFQQLASEANLNQRPGPDGVRVEEGR